MRAAAYTADGGRHPRRAIHRDRAEVSTERAPDKTRAFRDSRECTSGGARSKRGRSAAASERGGVGGGGMLRDCRRHFRRGFRRVRCVRLRPPTSQDRSGLPSGGALRAGGPTAAWAAPAAPQPALPAGVDSGKAVAQTAACSCWRKRARMVIVEMHDRARAHVTKRLRRAWVRRRRSAALLIPARAPPRRRDRHAQSQVENLRTWADVSVCRPPRSPCDHAAAMAVVLWWNWPAACSPNWRSTTQQRDTRPRMSCVDQACHGAVACNASSRSRDERVLRDMERTSVRNHAPWTAQWRKTR